MDRAVSPRMDGVGATSGAGSARASGSTPIALSYGAAAGVLMAVSLGGSVAFERAVLGATGFALLCDLARRLAETSPPPTAPPRWPWTT